MIVLASWEDTAFHSRQRRKLAWRRAAASALTDTHYCLIPRFLLGQVTSWLSYTTSLLLLKLTSLILYHLPLVYGSQLFFFSLYLTQFRFLVKTNEFRELSRLFSETF